jgi:hypothetical protein
MDQVTSFLDQIARLEAQNRNERDPDLRRENKKTIKELHAQARRAAKFREPWHGLLRNVIWLFFVFFAVVFGLLMMMKSFGFWNTLGASFAAATVMILITSTILLINKHISQATFKDLVKFCLTKLAALVPRRKPNESGDAESALPSKKLALPDTPPAPHVIVPKDPSMPAPKEKPTQ